MQNRNMAFIGLYWHTLRHLKPAQIAWRLRYLLQNPRLDQNVDLLTRVRQGHWKQPLSPDGSLLAPQRFRLLNSEGELPEHGRWQVKGHSLLWHFHLHYFDDLTAVDAGQRLAWHRDLIDHWIHHNPPGSGEGWHPYTISRRSVNWLKWDMAADKLSEQAHHSLLLQIRWLAQRLEFHLLGNHLIANAKALVFAGCYYAGTEADEWLTAGLKILRCQLQEQILEDGGHCERSTQYHAIILEDLLDLINLAQAYPAQLASEENTWQQYALDMMRWLLTMSHPDGRIALFNDATLQGAASPEQLICYMNRLGLTLSRQEDRGLCWLAASGYLRWSDQQTTLLLDCAPVGPDYQPGHGHADTLSFELSLFGQRVVVNSGVSEYGVSAERLRQRGTAAHNTVVVDGQNSSQVWSGFRVARRAQPYLYNLSATPDRFYAHAGHDGYWHLPGKVIHQRLWWGASGSLVIEDRLLGRFSTATAYLHFHPDIEIHQYDPAQGWVLRLGSGEEVMLRVLEGNGMIVESTWHPDFGRVLPCRCLQVEFVEPTVRVSLNW